MIERGEDAAQVARLVGTSANHLLEVATGPDPVETVLGIRNTDLSENAVNRLRRKVGELVRARAAEIAFQDICQAHIDQREYRMTDVRESHNTTDFRLLNGNGRRLYRFNVKFFGSLFQRSQQMVQLSSEDCFPLATYKIFLALQQQDREHAPYVFAIVGVPGLTTDTITEIIPETEIRPVAMLSSSKKVHRKRDFEDWLVDRIVAAREPAYVTAYDRIRNAEWHVLSVRRAYRLLQELMFQRVHALSKPRFNRNFPTAEVDMHFSLSQDMITLNEFLITLKKDGPVTVTHMLAEGRW